MTQKAIRAVRAEPLTATAFAAFGDVIHPANAKRDIPINHGHTTRYHDMADIDVSAKDGKTCVSIFRSRPMNPLVIRSMERHPLGSQAFIPLERRPYLVVVAPPGDFDAAEIRVFRAGGDQGVNYAKGVWHHFLLALEGTSDFLVIDRTGPGHNLDEITLPETQQFMIET